MLSTGHETVHSAAVCVLSSVSKDGRRPVVPPHLALLHALPDGVVPVADALRPPQVHLPLSLQVDTDGEVATLVQQLDGLDLRKLDGEDELAHLGDPACALLEALEQVPGEDEVPLLPPREELVPLLPQETLLQGQVCLAAYFRRRRD